MDAPGGGTLEEALSIRQLAAYVVFRRGMLTSNLMEAYGFIRSRPSLAAPDIELLFAPVGMVGEGLVPPRPHAVTLGAILLRPRSTGCICLRVGRPCGPADQSIRAICTTPMALTMPHWPTGCGCACGSLRNLR